MVSSMKIGRFYKVEFYLNWYFLGLLGLFFVAGVLDRGLVVFGSVIAHELTHVFAARKMDVAVSEVELLPFGGVARMNDELTLSPGRELYVAMAGPLCNMVLFIMGLAVKKYGWLSGDLLSFFLQCNIMVAFFNMLPALPLDGGRIYRAYLARREGFRYATYRTALLGQVFGVTIFIFGVTGIILRVSGLDIVVVGLFLFYSATREKRMGSYLFIRHLAQKKSELNRQGVLPAHTLVTVETSRLIDVVRPFVPDKFHLVFLVNKDGHFQGVIGEEDIINALLTKGANTPVGTLRK